MYANDGGLVFSRHEEGPGAYGRRELCEKAAEVTLLRVRVGLPPQLRGAGGRRTAKFLVFNTQFLVFDTQMQTSSCLLTAVTPGSRSCEIHHLKYNIPRFCVILIQNVSFLCDLDTKVLVFNTKFTPYQQRADTSPCGLDVKQGW